jgi:hypothetical protein
MLPERMMRDPKALRSWVGRAFKAAAQLPRRTARAKRPPSDAMADAFSIAAIDVEPLSIPLREPFVIATGRIDTTQAALVRATLVNGRGGARPGSARRRRCPRSRARISPSCWRRSRGGARAPRPSRSGTGRRRVVARALPDSRVARAGVEAAILDAWARHAGVPLYAALGATHPTELVTDITLPISDPERMAANARAPPPRRVHLLQGEGRPRLARGSRVAARRWPRRCRMRASAWMPTPDLPRTTRSRCSTPP